MKALRVIALVTTLLMGLANLPVGFTAEDADVPAFLQWPATIVGVLGIAAFLALVKQVKNAVLFTVFVGLLNAAAGIYVMTEGHGNGVVGLVLGVLAASAAAQLRRDHARQRTEVQ